MLCDRTKGASSSWTVLSNWPKKQTLGVWWKIVTWNNFHRALCLFQTNEIYLQSMLLTFPEGVYALGLLGFGPYLFQQIIKITSPITMEVNQ